MLFKMGIRERKEREKEMRQREIQAAAKEIFMRKGFNSTTMVDIAEKAELSAATIYQYFNSKEELYASLNLITLRYLFDHVAKVHKNNRLSVEKKIEKIKDVLYNTFRYEPLILRIILYFQLEENALASLSKDLLDQVNDLSHKTMTMIADVYEEGVRQGKFVDGHGMAHADIIWAMFTGLVVWEEARRKLNPKKDFLKSTLDKAFDIFCRGIRKE